MSLVDFKITLSPSQSKLFREEIKLHESLGDLRLTWRYPLPGASIPTSAHLHFDDYEGVEAFRRAIYRRGVASTRAYVSVQSVIDKIDGAVGKCCTRGGR